MSGELPMKKSIPFLTFSALALVASMASAQSAGTWLGRLGMTTIAPQVSSGDMSAPSFPGTKSDVSSASQVSGGITYMYTDNFSVDVPLALPFTHKLIGAGALAGAGQIGEVQALPLTVFFQYRFMEANSQFRPYLGLGATYAYFFNEKGGAALTAMTNPGGPTTTIKVDSKFTVTPQIGLTYAINDKLFVDVFYSKSMLQTRNTFSTGQTLDITLDPASYGITIGTKF
jgi:outer membrane protein